MCNAKLQSITRNLVEKRRREYDEMVANAETVFVSDKIVVRFHNLFGVLLIDKN